MQDSSPYDLRSFVSELDANGELVRIKREVDARFELPALLEQLERAGKAYIFENIAGRDFPLVGGLLSSARRMGLSVGQSAGPDYDHRAHARVYGEALQHPRAPVEVSSAPVKDVILTGADIDLGKLPVPTFLSWTVAPL